MRLPHTLTNQVIATQMASGQETFRPGARVLAYHGPLVYEAKVLKYHERDSLDVDLGEDETEPLANNKIPGFLLDCNAYFLHYKGWNLKWDEWVSSGRILEFNDDNLGLSRELRNARRKPIERLDSGISYRQTSSEPKPRKPRKDKTRGQGQGQNKTQGQAKTQGHAKTQAPVQAGEKGKGNEIDREKEKETNKEKGKETEKEKEKDTEKEKEKEKEKASTAGRKKPRLNMVARYEIQLPLLPKTKCVLVDDWELITKDRKLVDLDSVVPTLSILAAYYSARLPLSDSRTMALIRETIDGLQAYFDETLSLDLLYKFERLQYAEKLKSNPNLRPSEVYGLEHLLRLLSTLPARLSQVSMDSVGLNVLLAQASGLMKYLDANLESFSSSYITASPMYDRLAKG